MKLTGERPMQGQTPDSLLALHTAGYREVRARMAGGRFLDVGCGLGDESVGFAGAEREHLRLHNAPATAPRAVRAHGAAGMRAICSDGSLLALRGDTFDNVCSSHLIEHFTEPEHHVEEVARVLSPEGTAFFITPNEPADFENPYHVYLFGPDELRDMLGRHFRKVEVHGLDATPRVKADFEKRREMANKLLRLDPLGLRHKLPREAFVWLHATGRRLAYRFTNTEQVGGASGITDDEFFLTDQIDDSTLVLFAVCSDPID